MRKVKINRIRKKKLPRLPNERLLARGATITKYYFWSNVPFNITDTNMDLIGVLPIKIVLTRKRNKETKKLVTNKKISNFLEPVFDNENVPNELKNINLNRHVKSLVIRNILNEYKDLILKKDLNNVFITQKTSDKYFKGINITLGRPWEYIVQSNCNIKFLVVPPNKGYCADTHKYGAYDIARYRLVSCNKNAILKPISIKLGKESSNRKYIMFSPSDRLGPDVLNDIRETPEKRNEIVDKAVKALISERINRRLKSNFRTSKKIIPNPNYYFVMEDSDET